MDMFYHKIAITILSLIITIIIFMHAIIPDNVRPICILGTFIGLEVFMNILHHQFMENKLININ